MKDIRKKLGILRRVLPITNNQNELYFENGVMLQSYDSIIAIKFYLRDGNKYSNKIFLGEDWKYSSTTSKYRNIFLEEDTRTTEDKLNKNIYKLIKE